MIVSSFKTFIFA